MSDNEDPDNTKRLVKALTKPLVVQKTLQAMAEHYLPARMGLLFTRVVNSCLTCLEGGFEDIKAFEENNKQAIGIGFSKMVLQPLSTLANPMGAVS